MGWSFSHVAKGTKVEDFFKKEFNYTNETGSSYTKVLECKATPTVAYLAVEYKGINDVEPIVYGMVCLIKRVKDYCNFGYKAMDENCGPFYYDCPKSILDKLTATTNETAISWRIKCIESFEKNHERKTLSYGDTIKFDKEFSFGRYGKTDTFNVVDLKKGHFYSPKFGILVKLTKSNINNNSWSKVCL